MAAGAAKNSSEIRLLPQWAGGISENCPPELRPHVFRKGQSGNPSGRRSKSSSTMRKALETVFDEPLETPGALNDTERDRCARRLVAEMAAGNMAAWAVCAKFWPKALDPVLEVAAGTAELLSEQQQTELEREAELVLGHLAEAGFVAQAAVPEEATNKSNGKDG